MRFAIRLLAVAMILTVTVLGTGRFSGEKGARAHRIRLTAGAKHVCALLDDGTVACWGNNDFGQLGDGTFTPRTSPVPVASLTGVISIAAGSFHTCAILASGAVRCWGDNFDGQLGTGGNLSSTTPVAVVGLTNALSLAAGSAHTCAVRSGGAVWCWGDNSLGQLGTGTVGGHSYAPVQGPFPLNSGIVAVASGANHSCALGGSGGVVCWGADDLGQLGTGSSSPPSGKPVGVPIGFATDIAARNNSSCARGVDGTLRCWGDDALGQLGDGGNTKPTLPVLAQVSPTVVAIDGSCAILVDGTVTCWGTNFTASGLPGPPIPGVTDAVEIAGGDAFGCAFTAGGNIRCWGDNTFGQHGNGTTSPSGTDSVANIAGTFLGRGVSAGGFMFTCGRRGNGTLACWGNGTFGELGNGGNSTSSNPVAVSGLSNVIGVSTGNALHSCAVDAEGSVFCWGSNSRGQLGNGTTIDSNLPVRVSAGGPYVAVSTGDAHTCALTVDGQLRCWGANDGGQLGNGNTADAHAPVASGAGVLGYKAIAAGSRFTCAIGRGADVFCWGDSHHNQLDNGIGLNATTTPVQVRNLGNGTGFPGAIAIAAGASHVCALSAAGMVACWGDNGRGQMGVNSTATQPSAEYVQGLSDAVAISAGAFFTCAAQATGGASCWGANDAGELGAKDSVDHLTPTPVIASFFSLPIGGTAFLALSGVVAVATGTTIQSPTHEHACALLASGVIKCWGDNTAGEIGDGTGINRARPTLVNSFAANVDPAATLRNTRVAEVTALVNCEAGENAHITLTLEQGVASGTGHADARCEDRLVRVPMTVAAQGPSGFEPGAATAQVEAIGTHWTKQVILSISK